jgi:hypothetical protein
MRVGFSRCRDLPCVAGNAGTVRKRGHGEKLRAEKKFAGLLNVQKNRHSFDSCLCQNFHSCLIGETLGAPGLPSS